LFSFDPFGLATFNGFPPEKEQQMRDANERAIQAMLKCNSCKDCGPNNEYAGYCISEAEKQLVVHGLQNAQYQYRPQPPIVLGGGDLCGMNINQDIVHVYPSAFTKKCCSLPSTLAHEAGHIAGLTHSKIFFFEERCFNCKRW
jgi:hypothetical protein